VVMAVLVVVMAVLVVVMPMLVVVMFTVAHGRCSPPPPRSVFVGLPG
jgi:hypothetical protein